MAEKINPIRNCLKKNKIWFETVSASLLALMAVIVSIAQWRTASMQTKLLSLQTKVEEAQAMPQFEVVLHPKLNAVTNKFDDYILVVSDHGGPIHDFSADNAYFIQVTIPGVGFSLKRADVPVSGYFTISYESSAIIGEMVTMVGNHNNARAIEIAQKLRQAAEAKHWGFANMGEQVLVRFRYRDMLNRRHEDYYEAHAVGGGARLPDEVGKDRFAKWEAAAPRVDLSDVQPEYFFKNAVSVDSGKR